MGIRRVARRSAPDTSATTGAGPSATARQSRPATEGAVALAVVEDALGVGGADAEEGVELGGGDAGAGGLFHIGSSERGRLSLSLAVGQQLD